MQIGELLNDRHLPCRDPGSRQCADSDRSGELLSDSLHAGRGQQRDLLYIAGACVILGVIDVLVWKKGMKAYQSTGA